MIGFDVDRHADCQNDFKTQVNRCAQFVPTIVHAKAPLPGTAQADILSLHGKANLGRAVFN